MASWALGKMFSSEGEKEETQEPSLSDDESSDDEGAQEREAEFNRNKEKSNEAANADAGSNRSIHRYDEFGSFRSRSQRALHEHEHEAKHAEHASNPKRAVRQESGPKGKVSFQKEDKLTEVHEVPELTDDDKRVCFISTEHWVSIDTDIEITTKRWNNHVEGTIPFDEDNNTVRGIEVSYKLYCLQFCAIQWNSNVSSLAIWKDVIFKIDKNKPITAHCRLVLEEVVRQQTTQEYPNWEKIYAISESSSAPHREKAAKLGLEDEKEKNRVWAPKQPKPEEKPTGKAAKNGKKSKRKSRFFSFFKKK